MKTYSVTFLITITAALSVKLVTTPPIEETLILLSYYLDNISTLEFPAGPS